MFSFDRQGFKINAQDAYMVSGEFHYFRVPRTDWRRRMRLFRDAGGNCLATYVPWIIHEPIEGDIRFGDVDNRDLRAFLQMAKEEGLLVLLRPGPYQYSELVNDGLPGWLLTTYPEILALDIDGHPFRTSSISYLHPKLLEKARIYYRAFAEQVKPFMAENGGPVCMLQVDNELTGIHVWFGSLDYHPETMGFGKEDGRFPIWLKKKYGAIGNLNEAYQTQYDRFSQVLPVRADSSNLPICRRIKDYEDFYRATMAEYLFLLASWLREDGLHCPICHNSASPSMNPQFTDVVAQMGKNFLLGSDHYYTLGPAWAQNNPTPQYALRVLMSSETMRAMGMPPSVLELPGGSPSDTPPILPEDLLGCYMANLALGIKGVNFYVYTGGPNFEGTGNTCDLYDYNAHIRADGTFNATYSALRSFGQFMQEHAWLQRAHRVTSAQIGFEWNTLRSESYDYAHLPYSSSKARHFLERGLLYTMMCSACAPEMNLLTNALDTERPLIIPCPSIMSLEAQKSIVHFLNAGGNAMIGPVFPEMDDDYRPVSLLRNLVKDAKFSSLQPVDAAIEVKDIGRVFNVKNAVLCEQLPKNASVIATDVTSGRILGFEMPVGQGKMIWFGGVWEMQTFDQARMMEQLIFRLSGKPCVYSTNRNLFTSLWEDDAGHRMVFVMNLYSGAQTTDLHILAGEQKILKEIALKPMEVRAIEL